MAFPGFGGGGGGGGLLPGAAARPGGMPGMGVFGAAAQPTAGLAFGGLTAGNSVTAQQGQRKIVNDLHHKTFDSLHKDSGPEMQALVSRMVKTYEHLAQTDHEAKTVEDCRLPIQLKHLKELKEIIHRTKLEIEDVDNIKKKQEWLLEGTFGLFNLFIHLFLYFSINYYDFNIVGDILTFIENYMNIFNFFYFF